jgi:hypothetical protein
MLSAAFDVKRFPMVKNKKAGSILDETAQLFGNNYCPFSPRNFLSKNQCRKSLCLP